MCSDIKESKTTQTQDHLEQRYFSLGLRLARMLSGLSVAELARRTKISAIELAAYETGQETIYAAEFFVLCTALQISPDAFVIFAKELQNIETLNKETASGGCNRACTRKLNASPLKAVN